MPESYFAISLNSLALDSVPTFDLYLFQSASGNYVLYREKNLPFTQETKEKLIANKRKEIHVPREQRDDFFDYQSSLVAEVIKKKDLPNQEKAKVVYSTTTTIMEDLFVTPRSSKRIQQAKDTIRSSVDFMTRDEEATHNMLFMTSHDYYTYTHSVNVTIFATALAQKIYGTDSPEHDLKLMGEGFLLHDIGKSRIPASIINKPGKLNDREWELMRKHPEFGHEILNDTDQNNEVIDHIVLEHHERPDGKGYPRGFTFEEIHPYARICCIADVFDAITTVRSYRDPLSTFDALKVMRDEMGNHFDWDFFNEFVTLFHE